MSGKRAPDGLPQRLRVPQICVDLGLDLADDGEAAVDFSDDNSCSSRGGTTTDIVAEER